MYVEDMMACHIQLINLTPEQSELLHSLVRSREVPRSLVQRTQIILKAADGRKLAKN